MINWFKHKIITFSLLTLSFLPTFFSPVHANQTQLIEQIQILEEKFKTLSTEFYQDKTSYANVSQQTITDIDQLLNEVNRLINSNRSNAAIQLLYFNKETVNNNLDHKAVFTITKLLLENNEWNLANKLYQGINDEGDKSLLPTIKFIYAKYHAKRNEWSQVNTLTQNIITELSPENAAYAYLLNGSALQHLKKHRQAVENYNKIPASSQYHTYAQLNSAVANIRQGWWTDAQNTINDLIKKTHKNNSDELINRLYLVLGYALLQSEYYRDARDAFRHIGLNSRYTNRALLGIGLTATSQGDFVGGLNALTILKDKKTFDLSVDESYLLVPYLYEKLQQELTVAASYTEAMNYYQRRIERLNNISNQHTDFSTIEYDEDSSIFIIQNNSLDYGKQYPESFIHNYQQLIKLSSISNNKKLKKKIDALISKHDNVFQLILIELITQRKEYLKSYLNQSRYGLARLYDSSNEAMK